MKKSQSSFTAEGIALIRALESSKPADQRVCNDPLAWQFINPAFRVLGRFFSWYGHKRSPGVYEFLVARARYFDDYVRACLDDGLEQLVILGAGYDSRAYRLELLEGRVRVFEVDHPATQQVKLAKLTKIFGSLPSHVVYVPIDFDRETLEQRLCASGYDRQLKTLFTWEGVTYYISAEAVDNTLAFVVQNSGPGSSIVFDYMYATALTTARRRNEVNSMQRYRRLTGEGLVFGIEEGAVEEFLSRRGFCQIENVTAESLKQMYLGQHRCVAPVYAIVHATVKSA